MYREKKYIAGIKKNYSTDKIVVDAPRSKGSVLLVRRPIVGGKWMG
jgi:hypothetical protein